MTVALTKSNGIPQSTVAALNARRAAQGVRIKDLCHAASVGAQTYWRMVRGLAEPQRRTLVKLERALDRIERGAPLEQPPHIIASFWCVATLFFAAELDVSPDIALAPDGASCPEDPVWLAGSRARQLGFYLTNTELGVSVTQLAKACGTTKQRVHKAVNRIEDLRDDPAIDQLLDRASVHLSGRQPPAVTAGTIGKGIVP